MPFALNYLTSQAILTATEGWFVGGRSDDGNRLIEAMRTHSGPAYLACRDARQKVLEALARRETENPETLRIDGLNARYDETGRGIRSSIKAARDLTNDVGLEKELSAMDAALFPDRGTHWGKAMAEQGGDAEVLASAVTARHRELLRAQVHNGMTAEQYLDEHIGVGQALRGAVNAADAAAAAAAAAPNRVLPRAKAKLIKSMRTLITVLEDNAEFPRATLTAVVGPLEQAAERAQADALARRATPATPTPATT